MDDDRDLPEEPEQAPVRSDEGGSSSADRLVARLAELRGQLELIAPEDQRRGREAIERMRQAQERIATLEELLAGSRDREQELTAQAFRDRARISEHASRLAELGAIADRLWEADEARQQAATVAAEADRAAELARAEVEAQRAEIDRLRSRNSELEADLASLAGDLAAAAVARHEADRLRAERDAAHARAETERRLAGDDRLRAAAAELRATELQGQLRAAERRIVQVANGRTEPVSPTPRAAEPTEAPPPWIELQRLSSETAPEVPPAASAAPNAMVPGSEAAPAAPTTSLPDRWAASKPARRGASTASTPTAKERPPDEDEVIDLTVAENAALVEDGSEVVEEANEPTGPRERSRPSAGLATSRRSGGIWRLLQRRRD
jgi:hypothetical protein